MPQPQIANPLQKERTALARIFISHSGSDNDAALQLRDWLEANGWPDVFLDLDPERGIRAGDAWQQALIGAADRCEAIICLLTPQWVGSKWCWAEYVLAKRLGKKCFPVIAAPIDWESLPLELRAEHHIIDLEEDPESWTRLRLGLEAAGVGATGFALPEGRRPYPGLQTLTEEDAALFFGRDAEILSALDELRRMAQTPARRLLVILGPSGAGKSSLLRAGLWPRLARDDRYFFPLRTIRPGAAVLTGQRGFWAAVEGAFSTERIASRLPEALPRTRGALRAAADQDDTLRQALFRSLSQAAAEAALLEEGVPPTIIVPIDQGEELFLVDGREEAGRFLDLLSQLLAMPGGPIAVMAIRTDAYPLLQADRRIAGNLHQPFNLAPMPVDRFRAVIEGPAERVGLTLEPALTDALAQDARGADALPLLAFTMERLYRDYRAAGDLKLVDYRAFGGVQGAIEAAVDAAFAAAPQRGLSLERDNLLQLTRRLFLPHLVRVNEKGEFARRSALLTEIAEDLRGLTQLFVDQRLLVADRDKESGNDTIEIAHEALLRAWPRMAAWLQEEREFLIWREEIAHVRARWEDGQRDLLSGRELAIALSWRAERPADMALEDLAFLAESEQRAAADAAQEKRRQAWLTRLAVTAALVFAVFGGLSLWQRFEATTARDEAVDAKEEAQRQTNVAQKQAKLAQARKLAIQAETLLDQQAGATTLAGLLATESLNQSATLEGKRVLRRVLSLTPVSQPLDTPWLWSGMRYSLDGRLVAYWRSRGGPFDAGPASGQVAVIDTRSWQRRALHDFEGRAWAKLSADGRWMAVAGYGRRLRIFDNASGSTALDVRQDDMFDVAFHPDGQTVFVARTDGVIEVREAPSWRVIRTLAFPLEGPRRNRVAIKVSLSAQQLLIYGQTAHDGPLNPWLIPTAGGEPLALGTKRALLSGFTPAGDLVVTASWDDEISIWDTRTGKPTRGVSAGADVSALAVTPDGASVVYATRTGKVFLHDLATGSVQGEFHHEAWVNAVAVSADGEQLATASDDGTAVVWERRTGRRRLSVSHQDEVWAVAFGGKQTLLTGSKDGSLRATDIATGEDLHRFQFNGGVRGIAHEPVTGVLALDVRGTRNDQSWTDLVVVDRRSGEEISRIEHNGAFSHLAFRPDGDAIATATVGTGALRVWDTASGDLRIDTGMAASSLYFSRDGRRLVAGGGGQEVGVIDVTDGRRIATLGEPGGVEVVQILPDAQTAITHGQDDTFRAWDLNSGKVLWSRTAGRPDTSGVRLSGDGRRFAHLSRDRKTIEIAETRTGRPVASVPVGERASYVLSDDGGRLLITRTNISDPARPERPYSTVELWSVDSSQRLFARRLAYAMLRTEPLAGDKAMLLAVQTREGEDAGFVEVFDVKTGEASWSAEVGSGFITALRGVGRGDTLGLSMPTATQLRDLGTGALLFEAAGLRAGGMATLPDRGVVVLHDGVVIEVRDLQSGDLLQRIDDFNGIQDIRISADGDRLFAAINGDTRTGIAVWRTADWSPVGFIEMDNPPRSIHPMPDPGLIAVYDNADTLRIWRISTGEEVRRFAHTRTATGVAAAPDADRAVTWRGGSLRVWNTQDGTEIAHRLSHGGVTQLACSPDGHIVAYVTDRPRASRRGDPYKALVIWEPDTEDDPVVLPLESPGNLLFDPTGKFLAIFDGQSAIRLLDVASLRTTTTLNALPGAQVSKMAFSTDGALLYIAETKDGKQGLRVFRVGSGTEVARIDQAATFLPIPESHPVAVRDKAGQWRSWEVTSAVPDELLWAIKASELNYRHRARRFVARIEEPLRNNVPAILSETVIQAPRVDGTPLHVWAIDTDGKRVAGMQDGDAMVVALDDGRELARWPNLELQGAGMAIGHHFRPVRAMAFANRGSTLVAYDTEAYNTAEMASRLWLWRWQAQSPQLLSARNPINMIAVSPAGDLFASAEGNGYQDRRSGEWVRVGNAQIRIWNVRTGEEVGRIPMDGIVDAIAFSPAGDRLVARTSRGVVIFQVGDREEVARFEFTGRRTAAGSVAFTPDGQSILAEAAGGVRMWSLDGATDRLFSHGSDWPRYQLSDNGQLLVTLSKTSLRVWDVATGAALFQLAFPDLYYKNVLFLGADDDLVAETDRGLVRIPWKADHLIAEGCRRFVRDIDDEEWRRFLENAPQKEICSRDSNVDQGRTRN